MLKKKDKIGEGTYGVVYSAHKQLANGTTDILAVKRNLIDITTDGCGSGRELDIHARLKGFPFIVDLESVSFKNPFSNPMSPIDKNSKMKEDKIFFIMELISTSLDRMISHKKLKFKDVKLISVQMLLGLQWIHSKGISHRDIKPSNMLLSYDTQNNPILKYCDFGMSQILSASYSATPGVTTPLYRAPEICCKNNYNNKVDIWAVGCILFEMVSGKSYLNNCEDSDESIFNNILGNSPVDIDNNVIDNLFSKGTKLQFNSLANPIRRKSYIERLELTSSKLNEFNSTHGNITDYIDLMTNLLCIDPEKRFTIEQALNHKFFYWIKDYITAIHEAYPIQKNILPHINFFNCNERKWMINKAFEIYNDQGQISWYQHRILFHAIDLFDRYMEYLHIRKNYIYMEETTENGRFHNYKQVILRFYTCLYMFHKYFITMQYPCSWKNFVPTEFITDEYLKEAEIFEILVTKDVCIYNLYRETLLEIPNYYNHEITEERIREILTRYGNMKEWINKGSMRALYRILMNLDKNGKPITLPKVIKK